jgi:hypothetical protein
MSCRYLNTWIDMAMAFLMDSIAFFGRMNTRIIEIGQDNNELLTGVHFSSSLPSLKRLPALSVHLFVRQSVHELIG